MELRIIEEIGTNWKKVADQLQFHHAVIKTIEQDKNFQTEECCREMFCRWLDGKACDCEEVTWEKLIWALSDVQLGAIVN